MLYRLIGHGVKLSPRGLVYFGHALLWRALLLGLIAFCFRYWRGAGKVRRPAEEVMAAIRTTRK
jgi:hypothetical protein